MKGGGQRERERRSGVVFLSRADDVLLGTKKKKNSAPSSSSRVELSRALGHLFFFSLFSFLLFISGPIFLLLFPNLLLKKGRDPLCVSEIDTLVVRRRTSWPAAALLLPLGSRIDHEDRFIEMGSKCCCTLHRTNDRISFFRPSVRLCWRERESPVSVSLSLSKLSEEENRAVQVPFG